MSITEVAPVDENSIAINDALARARRSKPLGEIDPPLASDIIEECIKSLADVNRNNEMANNDGKSSYAVIETACRNIFYDLLSFNSINDAGFGDLWSLLDIVSSLSDKEICEPSLIFWLVEELLDSQTIDGCRVVFDYLDSRRDRLTANHFKEKSLVILRSCNELLRRLSRAEDTVFCGRVFIFLFQSFPLGDKSSVNLRGEFHVENVTSYERLHKEETAAIDGMDVDHDEAVQKGGESTTVVDTPSSEGLASEPQHNTSSVKSSKSLGKFAEQEEPEPDVDTLYEIFWSLQDFFSQPTKLFDESNLKTFRKGFKATMRKFKDVQKVLQSSGSTKLTDENKRGAKRKRSSQKDETSGSFNPKYLTSRELFDLEIKDLAFRRHILVQTLIILDFLLSLTPKAKKKLEHFNNRAVLYPYTFSDDNAKWAMETKADIAIHLTKGEDGKFYNRMVDTVLSRDKNWAHWKAESCPPIAKAPVSPDDYSQAIRGVQRSCANKRLKATPMGALDLSFLTKTSDDDGMENLKDPERFTVRTVESFERPVADDQFEIEMASSKEEKQLAEDAKASKFWRALRVASKTSLSLFDRFDDGKNPNALFRPKAEEASRKDEKSAETKTEEVKVGTEIVLLPVESGQDSEAIEVTTGDAVIDSNDTVGEGVQVLSMEKKKQEPLEERTGEVLTQEETQEPVAENAGEVIMQEVTSTVMTDKPPAPEPAEAAQEAAQEVAEEAAKESNEA